MMKRSVIVRKGCLFVALGCIFPALSFADIGVDNTQGPGAYQDSVLNVDADISKQLNFEAGYEQSTSSASTSSDLTKTYTADLTIKNIGHYAFGLSGSNSPEVNDAKSAGFGLNFSYNSATSEADDVDSDTDTASDKDVEPENFTWGYSLAYNVNTLSEYIDYNTYQKRLAKNGKVKLLAVDHSDWYALKQTLFDPSLTCSIFQLFDLNLGYSMYSYDKDVSLFSQRLAKLSGLKGVKNANFGDTTSVIDGFPDYIACAGIAVSPLECLKLEYGWSRTVYVLDQPQEDSSTFTLYYTIWSTLQAKAAYNVLSTQVVYTTLGLTWLW
jgi:hypothetical protein